MIQTYKLTGVSCSDCAHKLENMLNHHQAIKKATLYVAQARLVIEYEHHSLSNKTLDLIIQSSGHGIRLFDDTSKKNTFPIELIINLIGLLAFVTAVVIEYFLAHTSSFIVIFLYLASYLMIGGKVIYVAIRNMLRGHFFDEHFLMMIATIGALSIGEMIEAVAVMLFYRVGEYLQKKSVDQSRESILELLDIKPEVAHLVVSDTLKTLHPSVLAIGDVIIIKPGEKVPVDGTVLDGQSLVDTSSMTGEPLPKSVRVNDIIYSGSINLTKAIKVSVDTLYKDSLATKIINYIESNQHKKAKKELCITRFSKVYTPIIVMISIFLAFAVPWIGSLITSASFTSLFTIYFRRALILLVISCPCALVLSIPLSYFAGIGASSKKGLLFKGGKDLEALSSIDHFVFDKTGTLTHGQFEVVKVDGEKHVLEIAAHLESFSTHPIAKSITKAYGKDINSQTVSDVSEQIGQGITALYNNERMYVGHHEYINSIIDDVPRDTSHDLVVYVSTSKQYLGRIVLRDTIKQSTYHAIEKLLSYHKRLSIISGDHEHAVSYVGESLNITSQYHSMLPHQKSEIIEKLSQHESVCFVGDGINDAPVLLKATLGIAMGGIGSDVTIEASDAVIMTDDLNTLVDGLNISLKTRAVIIQNIVGILLVKLLIVLLGILGYASMWLAIFADVGVALLAVFNTMRILQNGSHKPKR